MKKQLVNGILAAIVACAFGLNSCNYEVPGDDGRGGGSGGGGGSSVVDEYGTLPGKFSVSKDKKVSFSRGNLQYCPDRKVWRFAINQYDYVGGYDDYNHLDHGTVYIDNEKCSNQKISSIYHGWIDLFGWGTSGWESGYPANQPWSFSMKSEEYFHGGDLTGKYIKADWGIYNAISNGGKKAGLWRTLTRDEWVYLFQERPHAYDLQATFGTYMGGCTMLLPDNFNLDGMTTVHELEDALYISHTKYDDYDQWNKEWGAEYRALEKAGAVFLPDAFIRRGTYMLFGISGSAYWTSTYDPDHAYGPDQYSALSMNVDPLTYAPTEADLLYTGLPVRLVRDVK